MLVLDGDHMGKWLRGEFCPEADSQTLQRNISEALMRFAVHQVPGIVKEHHGELIYSGGDDVLALVPTETALACTLELRNAYPKEWPEPLRTGTAPTASAGIAVVHYKEDLRLAARRGAEGRESRQERGTRRLGAEHSPAVGRAHAGPSGLESGAAASTVGRRFRGQGHGPLDLHPLSRDAVACG